MTPQSIPAFDGLFVIFWPSMRYVICHCFLNGTTLIPLYKPRTKRSAAKPASAELGPWFDETVQLSSLIPNS